jgi:hypothetical protein
LSQLVLIFASIKMHPNLEVFTRLFLVKEKPKSIN